jgi:hypothetical protein
MALGWLTLLGSMVAGTLCLGALAGGISDADATGQAGPRQHPFSLGYPHSRNADDHVLHWIVFDISCRHARPGMSATVASSPI